MNDAPKTFKIYRRGFINWKHFTEAFNELKNEYLKFLFKNNTIEIYLDLPDIKDKQILLVYPIYYTNYNDYFVVDGIEYFAQNIVDSMDFKQIFLSLKLQHPKDLYIGHLNYIVSVFDGIKPSYAKKNFRTRYYFDYETVASKGKFIGGVSNNGTA